MATLGAASIAVTMRRIRVARERHCSMSCSEPSGFLTSSILTFVPDGGSAFQPAPGFSLARDRVKTLTESYCLF